MRTETDEMILALLRIILSHTKRYGNISRNQSSLRNSAFLFTLKWYYSFQATGSNLVNASNFGEYASQNVFTPWDYSKRMKELDDVHYHVYSKVMIGWLKNMCW